MARGGAPSRIQQERKDVLVRAPAAVMGRFGGKTPPIGPGVGDKDVIAMQQAQIRELETRLMQQEIAATTIAVTTCALIKAIVDQTGVGVSDTGEYAVEIPKSLYKRLEGSELELSGIQKDNISPVYARIVPKSNAPFIGGHE